MKYKTHVAFSLLIYFVLDYFIGLSLLEGVLIVLISFVPDIDLHTSFIGKRLKPISYIFQLLFRHRGVLHSLWVPIILYILLIPYNLEMVVFGYLSHILLDILNPKGVALFWPFFRVEGHVKSGKIVDWGLFFIFLAVDFVFILIKILYLFIS